MDQDCLFEGWLGGRAPAPAAEAAESMWRENSGVFVRLDVPVASGRVFPSRSGWYELLPPRS